MSFVQFLGLAVVACVLLEVNCLTNIPNNPYPSSVVNDPQMKSLLRKITLLERTIERLQRHKLQRSRQKMLTRTLPLVQKKHSHLPAQLAAMKLRHRFVAPNYLENFYYPNHPVSPSYPYYRSYMPSQEYWD